ncbi:hypothetical protein DVH24_039991 [Malus domestica]|uniref:Uncharacterized protein n=1 Tax=Malus domestica TaxID=3750 RepID=A0A498I472_MALDO|nr:hypothetical protein DVH24_039991 [Malus domestica]
MYTDIFPLMFNYSGEPMVSFWGLNKFIRFTCPPCRKERGGGWRMSRAMGLAGQGRKALKQFNLLRALQSEIQYELSSNPFQQKRFQQNNSEHFQTNPLAIIFY